MKRLKVLVACEYSGIVRDAFTALGHDAVSCDLLPTERPGKHYQCDVSKVLTKGWDMMIAFPPCTYLCNGSLNWINRQPGRKEKQAEAIEFVKMLMDAPIKHIAIENPVGKISTLIRKPDQVLRVYQFGHPYTKDVCLWLKNLPKLRPTELAEPPYKTFDFASKYRKGPNGESRKSTTFPGVAAAMAMQWGNPYGQYVQCSLFEKVAI